MLECVFCEIIKERKLIIEETDAFISFYDKYPVTKGHTLVISKDHYTSFYNLKEAEIIDLYNHINKQCSVLKKDKSISGFNIGFNDGKDAGQTVMHFHVHIIPRRKNDTNTPRGGIRGVIPSKQGY